jgi:predicted acyl esterase
MDIFVTLRNIGPDGKDVCEVGQHGQPVPCVTKGWLRASHRKLDTRRTLPYRPYHTHDEIQKLTPQHVYELDIEVWPTCVVLPKGYRIALSVRGKDYAYPGDPVVSHQGLFTGVAAFRHDEPSDRPPTVFDADVTLHCGRDRQPYVLLPIIPQR